LERAGSGGFPEQALTSLYNTSPQKKLRPHTKKDLPYTPAQMWKIVLWLPVVHPSDLAETRIITAFLSSK
jgi:hypothetical protein